MDFHGLFSFKTLYLRNLNAMKKIFYLVFLVSSLANAQYVHDSVKVANGYVHFFSKGSGKAIVHLQGGPGFSHYYLRAVADSLPDYKNILIDYEGTGLSQSRKADVSWVNYDNIIENIEAVRKKLKIDNWILNGHSYGSHFAFYYAIKYPKNVSRIIVEGGAGTNNDFQKYYGDNLNLRLCEADEQAIKALETNTNMNLGEKEMALQAIFLKANFFDRSKISGFLGSFPKSELPVLFNPEFFDAFMKSPSRKSFEIEKQLLQLSIPIRMIEGRQDALIDGTQSLLNYKLRNSKLTFIERCGHFQWIEKPAEFFKIFRASLTN